MYALLLSGPLSWLGPRNDQREPQVNGSKPYVRLDGGDRRNIVSLLLLSVCAVPLNLQSNNVISFFEVLFGLTRLKWTLRHWRKQCLSTSWAYFVLKAVLILDHPLETWTSHRGWTDRLCCLVFDMSSSWRTDLSRCLPGFWPEVGNSSSFGNVVFIRRVDDGQNAKENSRIPSILHRRHIE
jgi:hypothetical protein